MSLTPEQQKQVQEDTAEVFEGFARNMRDGSIRVISLESEINEDWANGHQIFSNYTPDSSNTPSGLSICLNLSGRCGDD